MPLIGLPHFRFWCQSVLPLVYDDSLSYYEVLCKCVDYINKLIDSDKAIIDNVDALQKEMAYVMKWINDYDSTFLIEEIKKYIATMIFVEITDDGYIVYNIPESWNDITFNTTELDIHVDGVNEYGRLVLSY